MKKVLLSIFVASFVLASVGVASAKLGSLEHTAQSGNNILFSPAPVAANNTVVAGNQRGGPGGNQGGGQGGNQGGGQGGGQGGNQGGGQGGNQGGGGGGR